MITGPPENKMQAASPANKVAYRELPGPPQVVDRYCPACGLIGCRRVAVPTPQGIRPESLGWVCRGCGAVQVPA